MICDVACEVATAAIIIQLELQADLGREVGDVRHVLQVALLVLAQQVAGVAQSLLGRLQQSRVRLQLRHASCQIVANLHGNRH